MSGCEGEKSEGWQVTVDSYTQVGQNLDSGNYPHLLVWSIISMIVYALILIMKRVLLAISCIVIHIHALTLEVD